VLRRELGVKCDFPNLRQYDELKAKHPDALILMRRGDDYESVGSDAERVAEVCGIETFERVRADTDESVRMTSFASNALDTYLPKLIRAGERIAICEAMEQRSKSAEVLRTKSEESSCYAASVKSQELRVKNEVDADDSERKCGMKM
jgi:DNA mismatch repair ATPase MutS